MIEIEKDCHIARLIAGYLVNELNEEETKELNAWRAESPEHEHLFEQLRDLERLKLNMRKRSAFNREEAWTNMQRRIQRPNQRKPYKMVWRYAAALLLPVLLAGIGMLYYQRQVAANEQLAMQSIEPGSCKTILTLGNGHTVSLNDSTLLALQQQEGTHIQADSARLAYLPSQPSAHPASASTDYNKIETPRGGEYTLQLSDGTRVHLNAMSSLRYPVTFTGNTREVELTGEAYFEVAHTGQPFLVNTQGVQVEVLGTTFNVSAYPEEAYQATLITGSVRVSQANGASTVLAPSQQAFIAHGRSIEVRTVETAFYTSWIKGKIYFKDQRLEEIMTTLLRWYDMEVVYDDAALKDLRFGCNLNRRKEITPFVHLLEETGKVHVKVNGKTITFYN